MSFLKNLFQGKDGQRQISGDTMIFITEYGKDLVVNNENYNVTSRVLSALNERSPRSVRDIASSSSLTIEDVKSEIVKLSKPNVGLVKVMGE